MQNSLTFSVHKGMVAWLDMINSTFPNTIRKESDTSEASNHQVFILTPDVWWVLPRS